MSMLHEKWGQVDHPVLRERISTIHDK